MAKCVDEIEWEEMRSKLMEMDMRLQRKENEVNNVLENQEKIINQLKESILADAVQLETKSKCSVDSVQESFQWEISNLTPTTNQVNAISPPFTLKCFPIGFKVKLEGSGNKAPALALAYHVTNDPDALFKMYFYPTVNYTLCDVTDNEYKKHVTRSVDVEFGVKIEKYNEFKYEANLSWEHLRGSNYLSQGGVLTLKITVSFDHPIRTDAILQSKVDHYWMKRYQCKSGLVNWHLMDCTSTAVRGYRVRFQLHLHDIFTVKVKFITGKFDDDLKSLFAHVTTVVIENQWNSSPDKHLVKTSVQKGKLAAYDVQVSNHAELEAGGYLVDDTLSIKFIITPL